jgi:hypothetical protein
MPDHSPTFSFESWGLALPVGPRIEPIGYTSTGTGNR